MRDYARNIFRFDFRNDDVGFFVWVYEMEQFKPKEGRCLRFDFQPMGGFDLFVTGPSHFLLSEHSLSLNNVMITLTRARWGARVVELTSGLNGNNNLIKYKQPIKYLVWVSKRKLAYYDK